MLPIAVDFQPVALRLSKYRLALRATLLVWPRTSLLIISHGLSTYLDSTSLFLSLSLSLSLFLLFSLLFLFYLRLVVETHLSYRSTRNGYENEAPVLYFSIAVSLHLSLLFSLARTFYVPYSYPDDAGVRNMPASAESNCLYAGGNSRSRALRIGRGNGNFTTAISRDSVTSGKMVAIAGDCILCFKIYKTK